MKQVAKKEIDRLAPVFEKIEVSNRDRAVELFDFAKRYYSDSKYFFQKKKYVESFEAAIISWAYIDIGLKLEFFKVPGELRKHFTV